ncbi:uncharacterized protein TNCV_955701 [Trichonephila clavipes]|nr:uncharacterized protein TNCV_955701 [Trichonephila clavipes]
MPDIQHEVDADHGTAPNLRSSACGNLSLNLATFLARAELERWERLDLRFRGIILSRCYFYTSKKYKGQNIHKCVKKIRALQTVLEAKQEEFVDDSLIYAKSLCEKLDISFETGVTAEIRERFLQLQNLAQKDAFLRPEWILSMDELNLDQAPQDINK